MGIGFCKVLSNSPRETQIYKDGIVNEMLALNRWIKA